MRWNLLDKPDFAMIQMMFDAPGEQIVTETQAMVARDPGIEMKTSLPGGILGAAKRKLLGGESLFQNTFTATGAGQSIYLAPAPEGDVEVFMCDGQTPVFLNSGAFLASTPSLQLDTKWAGAKGFFAGAGLFLLRVSGAGPLFFSCYGGIHAVDVGPNGYVCDTSHIVGFTGNLNYQVRRVGGMKSFFTSGEGLVCEFRGQGRLWISTRNPSSLASFLDAFRPVKPRSND